MDKNTKVKLGITSAAVALGCAGIVYAVYKHKYRLRDAADAFNYLNIKTVTNEKLCNEVVNELRSKCNVHRAIGFDCEWVTDNGKRQPVALVQLSTYDGLCGLFRLSHMKTVPQSLKDLLEDESIYKIGVAPSDDAKYLLNDYSVALKSTLDIRHIAELCGYNTGGLAALSKNLLNVMLDKSWRVRCSKWNDDELNQRQISYAAADAHCAIKMFVNLIEEFGSGKWYSQLYGRSSNDLWSKLDDLCYKYTDMSYKAKNNPKKDVSLKERKSRVHKEVPVVVKKYPHATRSKPLYHNCVLQAPDGELLCTCDSKKALWYVEKQLADVVQTENPLTVRLRFEPAGRSVGEVGRYYQLTKENKCVVCGNTESYIRKNVVPREYRKYFPEIMKDHSSHDVVLLCVECHQRSNSGDLVIRHHLVKLCDAPLASHGNNNKYIEDVNCKKIRSAARALLHQSKKHVLPEQRRSELESILLQYYLDHDEVSQELLEQAADLQVVYENADYESHGLKVVEYFLERDNGLLGLEEMWREHFLSYMRPKYMPKLWSIKHNEERLRVRLQEGRLSAQDLKLVGLSKWL